MKSSCIIRCSGVVVRLCDFKSSDPGSITSYYFRISYIITQRQPSVSSIQLSVNGYTFVVVRISATVCSRQRLMGLAPAKISSFLLALVEALLIWFRFVVSRAKDLLQQTQCYDYLVYLQVARPMGY